MGRWKNFFYFQSYEENNIKTVCGHSKGCQAEPSKAALSISGCISLHRIKVLIKVISFRVDKEVQLDFLSSQHGLLFLWNSVVSLNSRISFYPHLFSFASGTFLYGMGLVSQEEQAARVDILCQLSPRSLLVLELFWNSASSGTFEFQFPYPSNRDQDLSLTSFHQDWNQIAVCWVSHK